MPQAPLVSVIIPALNAASVITQSLESVQNQTFKNFEALVVDDGSTDDTAELARRFCAGDSRFTLMQLPHSGVSVARNAAIARARGEWIAMQDADDFWLPRKLERQVELSRQDPRANFLFSNFYHWDGERDLRANYRAGEPLPEGDAARQLIFSCVFGNLTVMVRRETLQRAGLFDPVFVLGQDWDLWLRIADRGMWARGTYELLARYRRWPGSQTNKKLGVAECDVRILERNLQATRRPELRPLYARALAAARTKLEFVRARSLISSQPEVVPAAIWRAWRLNPRRVKWLMWLVLAVWPKCLGGRATAGIVHRKILRKW
jgi:glycosyltransferase involved in cell wall biosynthesis